MSQLFHSYEITRVPYWPKMARILGPSVAFHILLLVCVLYVPAVRDAVNVAGIFTDAKFVDKAYKKTQIGDDVQVIDINAGERFRYPDGYFSTGAPPDPMAPTIIAMAQPTPTPTPVPTPLPVPPPVVNMPPMNGGPMARLPRGRNPAGIPDTIQSDPSTNPPQGPSPITGTGPEANAQADQIAAANNISRPHEDEINRAPLRDFVAKANDLFEKGQLDFSKPIEVVIDTELDKDARFVNAVVVSKSGNVPLDEISKDMVAALSDSGALRFLTRDNKPLELSKMRFTIKMDQASFNAVIEAEAPSADRAKQMANGFNLLLGGVPMIRSGHDDEIAIAKGTSVTSDGKKLIATFAMPRQQAIELMKKQVAANKKPES